MNYLDKQIWEEAPDAADDYRARYAEGIQQFIARKGKECKDLRQTMMSPEKLAQNPELYREKYKDMLGLKAFEENSSKPAEMIYVGKDDVCNIYRLVVYITDEIPIYSMFLVPHNVAEPMPLVIAQHGGGGTLELCSGWKLMESPRAWITYVA